MTTAEERDAIDSEYERTLVCVQDCPAYDGWRMTQDEWERMTDEEQRQFAYGPRLTPLELPDPEQLPFD